MTDEEKNYYKSLIMSNEEIPFESLNIKNIPIKDIFKIGEERFFTIFFPYSISIELFDNVREGVKIFDIVISDETYSNMLIESFKLLFKGESVSFVNEINDFPYFKIGESRIDRNNFDKLADIVLMVIGIKKIKPKKEQKKAKGIDEESQALIDEYYKALEKSNANKKNKSNLYAVYKYVSNMENDYEVTKHMNIVQLYDKFNFLIEKDKYDFNKNMLINPFVDSKKLDLTHLYNKTNKNT